MKDFFNRRQRFSLRKYSFGVASVLLGTALFAAHNVQADEVATPTVSAGNPGTSVAGESSSSLVNTTTTAPQSNPAASVTSPSASATSTSTVALVSSASEVASASTTETTSTATAPATTATAAATASSTPTAAGTTSVGSATSSSTGATSTSAVTPTAVQPTVAQPVASTTQPTATTQPVSTPTATQPVASTQPTSASVAQPATTTLTTSTPSPTSVANTAALTTMLTANPMSAAGTAPEVRSRSSRRRRDAANPVTTNYTTGPATATPAMSDPNGATISSRPLVVPTPKDSGQHVTTGIDFQLNPNPSQYTFAVTDLNSFNATYNKKYYYRLSKPYNASNDITIELVDGQNNNVVETKSINGSGTVSLGQSILAPLTGSSQAYIEFRFENIQDADKSSRPALRATWKVSGLVQNFAGQRSGIQIYDVANKANEGTSITDPQYYIPRLTDKTTYYKAVDRGTRQDVSRTEGIATITTAKRSNDVKNSDIVARYADGTVDVRNENGQIVNKTTYVNVDRNNINPQEYKEDGAEINLGTYTSTGMEGQNLTASGLRAFEGYKLYQTADSRSLIDVLKQPFHVGQRWFDVANAQGGVKRIKEVVSEDGTVRIEMWAIKSDSLNKISSDLNTDGYFKVYETVIPPGKNNYDVRPQDAGKDIDVSDPGWNQDNNTPQIPKPGFEYIDSLKSKLVQGKPFTIFSDKQVTNYKGDLQFEKTENNVTTLLFKRPNGTFYKMDKEYLQDASGNPTGKVNMKETDVSATDANGYKPTYVSKGEFYVNRGDKDNAYSINGTPVSSGNVFRLQNDLNPVYRTVYYYAKPEPVKVKLQFTKALAGRTLQDGEFDFKIQDTASGYNETVSNQNGKVTFSELTFTKPGVYTYKVNEVPGTDTDVDYDGMESTVTITVTEKNAIGDLDAKVTYTSINGQDDSGNTTDTNVSATNPTVRTGTDTEFNNFVVAPVNVEFDFTKKLSGRNLKANEFTFNLLNEAGAVVGTAKNDLNGNIKFTGIKYKVSDLGTNSAGKRNDSKTFNYTVKEVVPTTAEAGMSYDQMEAKVAVTVTKTGHTLTTATTYSSVNGIDANGNPTTGVDKEFNNTFTPNPVKVNLEFDKSLSNGTLNAGDFSFKLTGDGNVNETVTNKANGKINFSTLSFDKAGVYNYTVKEVPGTNTDVDYDAMTINVKVTVTKDANTGLLSASTVMTSSGGEATDANDRVFNNYVVPAIPIRVDFKKALVGRPLKENEFTFEMKDKNGVVVATGTNDEHGVVTFNQLPEVKNAQVGKVIKYTVSEKVPANKEFGVTYDNMVAEVSVTVSKNADHTLKATVAYPGGDTEFNNTVTPPTTPDFQPEKFIVNKKKFDITGNKLMDDDNELTNEYTETNADPYVDKTNNNEPENLNTKTVKKGDEIVYQVWLDTTKLKASDNIQAVGITDKYEADKLEINVADIKAYDSVTGADVTSKFVITVNNGEITATSKDEFIKDKVNNPVIDTTKFEFGRYYKFDIPATVKTTTPDGVDIVNTANQIVHQYDPTKRDITKPEKPTQKRVVNLPISLPLNFTKRLDGRQLQANEFTFELRKDGVKVAEAQNGAPNANGVAKINFKALQFTHADLGKTYTYTVNEVAGSDATVTYDTMVATITVTIQKDGTAKAIVAHLDQDASDKEFNNKVKPPEEPKFNPEKYVVSTEKFDITGDKLLDDDSELADKYGDTNANPYADGTANNEPENLNTKTVKPGSKLVYQVWLDTTQFSATNTENIQTVGITDNYDEAKLNVNSIKVYDSVTGADVTSKFDIANTGGVITATLKAGFTKSLGDANNTQIIDTTKFAFGRYYKFDISTTVKTDAPAGKDIENTAGQIVHYYNPRTNTVEKPEKPTEKRVNSVPVPLELNFTKKLDGRQLKANEFTFVLKKDGVEVERAKNDAPDATTGIAKINFTKLEFGKDDIGKTYNYTVEEVKGTDSTVSYDGMVATVRVSISHDGTAKAIVKNVVDAPDKEFDNRVTPPEEPKFNPEKYVVRDEDFDLTGKKLLDDDSELADKYGDTKINPYADKSNNNEKVTVLNDKGELEEVFENLNTQPVKRGQKFYYQVWLDTTQFSANNKENIQTVGITDNYDESKLIVTKNTIKVYDGETGADVTSKFDVAVTNGIITANLKSGFTKSLGDANNTQVIDTTKFEFGRYYKVVIPATVSQDAYDGSEIENTATQMVHYYNPRTHKVENPDKPTQKRVNNIPTAIQLIFGKTLNGRKLQADEFSFVLKDKETNKILEKAKNDADGKVTFKTINYSKADIGQTFNYIVEEEKGDKPGVTYDDMKVNVTVQVIQPSSGDQLSTVISYATEGGDAFTADDTVFDNNVTPNFKPEKYVVSKEKFDLKGTKLLDDDAPNGKVEAENLNHHTLTRGQKFYYQVWLDTREFTAESNIQSVGITDDYDEAKLDIDESAIKVYDGETDVTDKFDISIKNGVIYATSKPSLTKPISATDATPVIDTTKFAFGRYYKFDIPATVKNIKDNDGVEFSNTANEIVHQYNPYNKQVTTPKKPTQTRENNVPVPLEFNYTKKLEGRELTAGEFSFLLKDQDGKVLQTVSNDKDGHIKFEQLLFSKADLGKTFTYTVEEVNDNKPGISYDAMKATVTVQVTKDGKILKTVVNHASTGGNATDANDKEFNNKVVPPEKPKFQPEKYVVNQEKFDITGDKLVDDDKELADKYADTNANPYVDKTDNNEKENLNTKTVKRGDKLVYQVWLDTTKFDANNKDYIQTVGITDNYDEKKLNVNQSDIKAYDGKTGKDVTAMFDIKVENGVITANLKDGFTKSLGDKDNTQIIDTTKFAFGRYYKFDIPAIVKDSKNEKGEFDVPSGSDIENTAGQTVHYYDPTVKKVVKTPEKPTEKRVVNISASVTFEFTKKLEGRDLKAGEFSFVLKDRKGKVIETVSNDADGKIKFSALEYKHGEEGIHFYTVEEVKGNDTTVTYDKMVAKVTVLVAKGGNVMTVTSKLPEDTEFNNIVTPPTPPTPVVPPVTPPTPPTPVVPPVTPPTPPTPVVPPVTPPTPPTPVVPPVTPPTPPTPVVPPVTPPTPPTPVVPPVTPPTSPEVSREQGLPKTGENKSVVAMAFGGLLAAAGLGLAGKRKKED
ncbi:Spy0128 family protein [Streptococcus salivarius]|jgi:adhesin isopeptide-forming family sspB-C2 type protein/pilin isopeptide linkage protein/LPXTG-motif cell wall-anchored protein|uniref:Spy0128 family protein n=1 Tax=Streptococcus salivarius TaxID=1304 RepID=UPI0005F312B8|nr:FctA domain-containing protein [Streptococcus salivarius]KJU91132.1 surface-anchored protein [Streptococcus salivarius]